MFLFRILSYLPFFILYGISDLLAFVAYYVIRYRKKVVFDNLRRSFPEKSEDEIKRIAKGFYRNLADIIVEIIKEITISKKEIARRVEYVNTEEVMSYLDHNKSVIVVAIHQCNWEWLLLASVGFSGKPTDVLYLPLSNKSMDEFMIKVRSRLGAHPIPVANTIRQIAKRSKITRTVALLADQTPSKESDIHWGEFLNQETAFYKGPDVLARFTKYPVFYTKMIRVKRGYYQVQVIKVAEPPYTEDNNIISNFIKLSEETIREDPSNWLWSHRRWKLKKPD